MADLTLRKVAETATTITVGWDTVPGAVGFRFTGGGIISHTWDGTRTTVKFAKTSVPFTVEALVAGVKGTWPQATPPPPPPPVGIGIKPGASWQGAYDEAKAGDVLNVLAGNHGSPTLTGSKVVTFKGESGAIVKALPGTASNVTFENLTVDTGPEHGWRHNEITAANVTWKNVDVKGQYATVWTNQAQNFKWLGGTFFGPPDQTKGRVNPGDGEPLNLDGDVALIEGVTFGKFVADHANDFHLEDIRIEGSSDITIRNCTFTNGSDAGSGHIFITNFQPSTSVCKRITIEGCVFPPVIGTFAIQIHTNVQTYTDWQIKGNQFDQPILDPGNYVNLKACGNTGQVPASWKAAC